MVGYQVHPDPNGFGSEIYWKCNGNNDGSHYKFSNRVTLFLNVSPVRRTVRNDLTNISRMFPDKFYVKKIQFGVFLGPTRSWGDNDGHGACG